MLNKMPAGNYVAVMTIFWLTLNGASHANFLEDRSKVCGSMDIVSLTQLRTLSPCKIIDGYVRIALISLPDAETQAFSSDVEEISEYLLIYRVGNLTSLRQIFSKLRIIRGLQLFDDTYALIVHENHNLRNLGLVSLLRIQRGDVRVSSNFQLCYVETIDWSQLTANSSAQHLRLIKNSPLRMCGLCAKPALHCWDAAHAQITPPPPTLPYCDGTPDYCASRNTCCDRNCVLQCGPSDCELCANLRYKAECVDQCPLIFVQIDARDCISELKCRKLGYVVYKGNCLRSCPRDRTLRHNRTVHCSAICPGDFVIRNMSDLAQLDGCDNLIGSLDIDIGNNMDPKFIPTLRRALSQITVIDSYLRVQNSKQLLSLGFMDNLVMIGGRRLLDQKYALYVVNNEHLEQIWHEDSRVYIKNGGIFFHLNPRLCYETIMAAAKGVMSKRNMTIFDVSPNSNGERTVCDSRYIMNLTIEDRNATAIKVATGYFAYADLYALVGYTYHYRESPAQNLTMYDERHACGRDEWHMDIQASVQRRHIIGDLKPNTQYAIFVRALTRTEYHMKLNAYTDIIYVRTLPSRANPVRKVIAHALMPTQIKVLWWPPLSPNGEISEYIVSFEKRALGEVSANDISGVQTDADWQNCTCPRRNPHKSGPLPNDVDHYNRATLMYDEVLANIIYTKKGEQLRDPQYFHKIRGVQDLELGTPTTTYKPDVTTKRSFSTLARYEQAHLKEISDRLHEYNLKLENDSMLLQDDDCEIVHPQPVCEETGSNNARPANDCVARERYEGFRVDSSQYSIIIDDILPGIDYLVAVRACVKDVDNGCSKPVFSYIRTI